MKPPDVLCQPDASKSCGACCGMYNRSESGEQAALERIRERTEAYHRQADIEDEASLADFRAEWETTDPEAKLLEDLPNCPFLGLLDYAESTSDDPTDFKVGCLVHPLQNDGTDGRDCGVYDRMTCEEYLCAAHDLLRSHEKLLVIQATEDSYLYGLVITDVKFVRELLELTAEHNGKYPSAADLQKRGVAEAAADYFELKRDWEFAAEDAAFGQMVPGEGLETSRREGPSSVLDVEPDRYEAVLTCLATDVDSADALREARARVAARVEGFAAAVAGD